MLGVETRTIKVYSQNPYYFVNIQNFTFIFVYDFIAFPCYRNCSIIGILLKDSHFNFISETTNSSSYLYTQINLCIFLQFRTQHHLATCRYDEKFNGFVEHRLNYLLLYHNMGFSGSSAGKETTCNAGYPGLNPGLRRFSWKRDRLPTPVFLGSPGRSDG